MFRNWNIQLSFFFSLQWELYIGSKMNCEFPMANLDLCECTEIGVYMHRKVCVWCFKLSMSVFDWFWLHVRISMNNMNRVEKFVSSITTTSETMHSNRNVNDIYIPCNLHRNWAIFFTSLILTGRVPFLETAAHVVFTNTIHFGNDWRHIYTYKYTRHKRHIWNRETCTSSSNSQQRTLIHTMCTLSAL